jgi:ribonuclease VapC
MVVDTSIILSVFFKEKYAEWAAEQLNKYSGELCMSTVNLAETLILLKDRQPKLYDELEEKMLRSGIRFIPPDISQARLAAQARIRYPLNLGDCFAYALAKIENFPILTLDPDFKHIDCPVKLP